MNEKKVMLELSHDELEVIKESMSERTSELRRDLLKVNEGNLSVGECGEFESELDAEFYLDLLNEIEKKVTSLQLGLKRNQVNFIQQDHVFRMDERVKVYQVRNKQLDQLVFIHETRHGVHFFYSDIEALIRSYTEGEDSEFRFECEKATEYFLLYWKGGLKNE